jgi:hypothetical protein
MNTLSTRAQRVLAAMGRGNGPWINLALVPGVGRVTIGELLDAGAIEIHPGGRSAWSYEALYRVTDIGAPDLGDLWVD